MSKVILSIEGMSCSACSQGLEKYLNKQPGVINATVNLVLAQAMIEYTENVTLDELNTWVKEAGFISLGIYDEVQEKRKKNNKNNLLFFTILSILVLYISMAHMLNLPIIPFLNMEKYPLNYSITLLILTIPYLFYGLDIFKSGYKNLIHKSPNMDTLVSIGVITSFLYSLFSTIMILTSKYQYVEKLYFESVCLVLFFIKLGRFIDSRSKEKTKDAIKELVQLTPEYAILKVNNKEKKVTLDEISKGDILVCKPGMKIAVDGTIVKGNSHFDESFITGESIPTKKKEGEKIVAGSLNIDGFIEYKAEKIGKDSTISEIVKLVIEATNTKAPISKLADRVSGVFVPSIMLIALLTFIIYLILGENISIAFTHFTSVLVVACPCALGLATPLAIVISEGICAKNGILVKTSETLENAHKVDTIVFDKTGTLTYGNLKISEIINDSPYSEKELLQIIASIEEKSTHPIAKAITDYAKENKLSLLKINNFKELSGIGLNATIKDNSYYIGNDKILSKLRIENKYLNEKNSLATTGNSLIYVVENKNLLALIGVKDIVREEAKKTIFELKKLGKKIIMLTGDNELTANGVASQLDIDEVIANVLPKDKTKTIKRLMESNMKVMMIGDGINDAPSLATSSIGVALSSGTDIANNSANVILINDNLTNIINLITISKKTIKNIKQNLFWAFFYNICMIPVAIGILSPFGITLSPMIAGLAMTISSLTVVFNALRLKNIKLSLN